MNVSAFEKKNLFMFPTGAAVKLHILEITNLMNTWTYVIIPHLNI